MSSIHVLARPRLPLQPGAGAGIRGVAAALRRALAALRARCTPTLQAERDALLNQAVDHCDLEWRVRELDRRWAQSGFGVGGSRF